MSTGMARDLSAKLQGRLGEVLRLEVDLLNRVFGPAEVGEILIEAAVMVVRTNAATIAGCGSSRAEIEKLYRAVIESITAIATSSIADGVARTAAAVEKRAA